MPSPANWLDGTVASSRRRIFATSAFDGSVAVAVLAASESLLNPVAFGLAPVPLAAALGAWLGACVGLAQMALLRRSPRTQTVAWCVASAALGLVPAVAVGSVAKLRGPHHTMALVTLLAAPIAGAAVGVVLSLGQPRRTANAIATRTPWLVLSLVIALASAAATELSDETLLVLRGYPPLRAAIFGAACLLFTHAGIAVGTRLRASRHTKVASRAALALWTAVVVVGLFADALLSNEHVGPLLTRPIAGRLFLLARAGTDFDGDGSSSMFGGGDCAPFDARVNSQAREIPGNGIDDNCRYGDAKVKATRAPKTAATATMPPPVDVVLITIDTLRADHLGSYGYARPTTPHIDEFGKTALRFTHAYTSGGWTCLAMNSMLVGLYPRQLDWTPVAMTTETRMVPPPLDAHLAPGEHSLAMLSEPTRTPVAPLPLWLEPHGVRTAAIVANKPGILLDYGGLLDRAFDHVVVTPKDTDDSVVVDAALTELTSLGSAPFLLWVHLYEPHEPYAEHPGVPAFGDELVDKYDHDVAFMDVQVGRLLAALDARHGRPTAIILAADHGEAFLGGLPVHGEDLHEESIHIPMFVRGPGTEPGTSDAYVSLVDVVPTVLEWTGVEGGDRDGVSLLHPLTDRAVITDIWRHDDKGHLFINLVGVTAGEKRLVRDQRNETWTMYAAHDMTRPMRALDEPIDEKLRAVIGRYLEETGELD